MFILQGLAFSKHAIPTYTSSHKKSANKMFILQGLAFSKHARIQVRIKNPQINVACVLITVWVATV